MVYRRKISHKQKKENQFTEIRQIQSIGEIKYKRALQIEAPEIAAKPEQILFESRLKFIQQQEKNLKLKQLFKQKQPMRLSTIQHEPKLQKQIRQKTTIQKENNIQIKDSQKPQSDKIRIRFLSTRSSNSHKSGNLKQERKRSNTEFRTEKAKANVKCKLLLCKNSLFPFLFERDFKKENSKIQIVQPFDLSISRIEEINCPQAPRFISRESQNEVIIL